MVRLVLFILSFFVIVGCASKQEKELTQMYKSHQDYHKALLKTEKSTFRQPDGSTQLAIVATYLPKADHQQKIDRHTNFFGFFLSSSHQVKADEDESFIVGLYSDDVDIDHWKASGITMKLDGKTPISVKPIDPNDKRLKVLPFHTEWSAYYLVRFPHSSTGLMHLDVTFDRKTKHMLFSKRAKYVYTKKAFE